MLQITGDLILIFFSDLYGKGNLEMVMVDQIVDTVVDVFVQFVKIVFNPDKEEMVLFFFNFNFCILVITCSLHT